MAHAARGAWTQSAMQTDCPHITLIIISNVNHDYVTGTHLLSFETIWMKKLQQKIHCYAILLLQCNWSSHAMTPHVQMVAHQKKFNGRSWMRNDFFVLNSNTISICSATVKVDQQSFSRNFVCSGTAMLTSHCAYSITLYAAHARSILWGTGDFLRVGLLATLMLNALSNLPSLN